MHAAILAVSNAPPFAFATWLGGSGLSVCGLVIIQYFPIRVFDFQNQHIVALVKGELEESHLDRRHSNLPGSGDDDHAPHAPIVHRRILAAGLASPVVIAFWSSMLFVAGIIDYIIETDMKYPFVAVIPVGTGIVVVVLTIALGEYLGRAVKQKEVGV